jgi:hypothetical protein
VVSDSGGTPKTTSPENTRKKLVNATVKRNATERAILVPKKFVCINQLEREREKENVITGGAHCVTSLGIPSSVGAL